MHQVMGRRWMVAAGHPLAAQAAARILEAGGNAIDAAVAAGLDPGPLAGVPIALKDNLCTRGIRTTASSRMLEHYVPPYDATVVARLDAAGASRDAPGTPTAPAAKRASGEAPATEPRETELHAVEARRTRIK